jgi:hypothetical protein
LPVADLVFGAYADSSIGFQHTPPVKPAGLEAQDR